jgi:hypothetical protein
MQAMHIAGAAPCDGGSVEKALGPGWRHPLQSEKTQCKAEFTQVQALWVGCGRMTLSQVAAAVLPWHSFGSSGLTIRLHWLSVEPLTASSHSAFPESCIEAFSMRERGKDWNRLPA